MTGNRPKLRRATTADIPAVVALDAELFGADAWSERTFQEEFSQETRHYFLAEQDSPSGEGPEILGYIGMMILPPEANVQTIGVSTNSQGQGIGALLLSTGIELARSQGVREIFLEVRENNSRAQELYTRYGFQIIDRRRRYYRDGCDARIMRARMQESLSTEPLIMGIETSCDETGIGIVRGRTLLANIVASSMAEHVPFGGVIPEIAARAHLTALQPSIEAALVTAGVQLDEIDAIAVTAGPGLAGALIVGISAAKALAVATGKPLYGVNHLVAHIAAGILKPSDQVANDQLSPGSVDLPEKLGALLVSGGHTEILAVRSLGKDVTLLGGTIDDAAGEAFDKIARILGMEYPGGPAIDRAAQHGDRTAYSFPRGLTAAKYMGSPENPGPHRYDFSFSGLKTAVARVVEAAEREDGSFSVPDIAASFQEAVMDVVTTKAVLACQEQGLDTLLLGGGVAANRRLRELLTERTQKAGIRLIIPEIQLCTDNGAMIAALGAQLVADHVPASALDFAPDSSLPVERISL